MGVYKEGKNWKVQVYYKDWQGNRKRKQKRGFRTKGEAKEWERDFLQQQSQGVDIEFGNFLEIYYKDMDVRLRENTMYTKRYIIDLKIKPYFEKIGVACPKCGKDIVMKKTKKGRKYYGCIDNPECDFMVWQKPSGEKCPRCGKLLLEKGNKLVCMDEQCGYVKNKPTEEK